MKRTAIVAFMALVSLLSFAQDDTNYSMLIHLSDGTTATYEVADVDSITYSEQSDETSETSNLINGHEYVDLGLSVKWASCNIGAESPEDYGNYYAWGETETKYTYTSDNSVMYGVDLWAIYARTDISGYAKLDAATANWGGSWRMPTYDEMKELIDDCTWQWTRIDDGDDYTLGYTVTGPNGNSIFLPAAGARNGTSLDYAGSRGYYWSSTPYSSNTGSAYCLVFYSSSRVSSYFNRRYGRTVRPVSE